MLVKARKKPPELALLELLCPRGGLNREEEQYMYNLQKGHEGEVIFDEWMKNLEIDCLILNDLLLSLGQRIFQIDALILVTGIAYLYEIKNYEGDFHYHPKKLKRDSGKELENPRRQLDRTSHYLDQLLKQHRLSLPIKGSVAFVNPEFTLYNATPDEPYILPTQMNRLTKKLNALPSRITRHDRAIAKKLISLHMEVSPFTKVPKYDFDQLIKGILCALCRSSAVLIDGRRIICLKCHHEEMVGDAVVRHAKEIRTLFPKMQLTTNVVYEWCGGRLLKERIRDTLNKYFKKQGVHQWTYYE